MTSSWSAAAVPVPAPRSAPIRNRRPHALLIESAGCLGGASTMRDSSHLMRPLHAGRNARSKPCLASPKRWWRVTPAWRHQYARKRHRGVFVVIDPEATKRALDEVSVSRPMSKLRCMPSSAAHGARTTAWSPSPITIMAARMSCRAKPLSTPPATAITAAAFGGAAHAVVATYGDVNLGTLGTRFGGIAPDVHDHRRHGSQGGRKRQGPRPRPDHQGPQRGQPPARLRRISSATWPRPITIPATMPASPAPKCPAASKPGCIWTSFAPFPDAKRPILPPPALIFGTRKSRHINSVQQLT